MIIVYIIINAINGFFSLKKTLVQNIFRISCNVKNTSGLQNILHFLSNNITKNDIASSKYNIGHTIPNT